MSDFGRSKQYSNTGIFGQAFYPLIGGGVPPAPGSFEITATMAGAGNIQLKRIGVKAGDTLTIDWGDGNSNNYTGAVQRTHAYGAAGTYTIRMTPASALEVLHLANASLGASITGSNPIPATVKDLELRQMAGFNWTVGGAMPAPAGLTSLYLFNCPNIAWTVGGGAGAGMPAGLTYIDVTQMSGFDWTVGSGGAAMPSGLKHLRLSILGGFAWTVSASLPMPSGMEELSLTGLTGMSWLVSSSLNMPSTLKDLALITMSGISWTIGGSTPLPSALVKIDLNTVAGIAPASRAVWKKNDLTYIRYLNGLSQAQVDEVLLGVYENKANYTGSGLQLLLKGGANAAPSGTYQDPFPSAPSTGREYSYALQNSLHYPGTNWTVTTQ